MLSEALKTAIQERENPTGAEVITELPSQDDQMDPAPAPKTRKPRTPKAEQKGENEKEPTEKPFYCLMDRKAGTFTEIPADNLNKTAAANYGDDTRFIVQAKPLTVSVVVNGVE